jgi:gamma-glutamyltranspeptidase
LGLAHKAHHSGHVVVAERAAGEKAVLGGLEVRMVHRPRSQAVQAGGQGAQVGLEEVLGAVFHHRGHLTEHALQQAVTAPRWLLGRTWGGETTSLKLESRFEPGLIAALKAAGHEVEVFSEPFSDTMGHAGALVRHPNGVIEGAADPRSDGVVAGV